MSITATELRENLSKYLLLSLTQDIYITEEDGRTIAKLCNPNQDKIEIAKSLFGVLPDSISLEEAREERISKI